MALLVLRCPCTKPMRSNLILLALGISLVPLSSAFADEAPRTLLDAKSWKFENSLTARAAYDTNVYNARLGTLANQKSFVLAVAPTVQATHSLADGTLSLTYTPTGYLYSKNSFLNYLNQVFGTEEKFKAFDFDWSLKQSLTWVAGQTGMPVYANDAGTAYSPGFTAPSEQARTNQLIWGESFNINKKWDKYLVEFVGEGSYFDYRSRQATGPTGFLNCTDRFDVNAGFNVGYKTPFNGIYALAGYRTGYQWQGINPTKAQQYSSQYNRYLVGLRGEILKGLTLDFVVGPDMRTFKKTVAANFDRSQTFWYFAGSATYKPTKENTLSATFSRKVVMASTGGAAYEDIVTNLKYARTLTSEFSVDGGVNILQRPYMPNIGAVTQHYVLYSPFLGVNYAPKGNLSYRASWMLNSAQADTPAAAALADAQEYSQNVLSVEAKYKF